MLNLMVLALHIVSAVVGSTGAYLCGFTFFRKLNQHSEVHSDRAYQLGRLLVLIGLVGSAISGVSLLVQGLGIFLQSSKFLSNMTVLGFLVIVEISLIFTKRKRGLQIMHVASLWSWAWIFVIALLTPRHAYETLMMAYALTLGLVEALFAIRWRVSR